MYDIAGIHLAQNVADAVAALQAHDGAVVVAGGSDVLIKTREGRLAGCYLVSINGLAELQGVSQNAAGDLEIGPLTTFCGLMEDALIQAHIPVLGQAAAQVGGPQIRAVGTVGGNISNGVTSADTASTLMALNAVLTLTGPNGTRTLPIQEYYLGPGKVALEPAELLTRITVTRQNYVGYRGHYIKYAMRNAMDIATMGCVALLKLSADGQTLADLRLGFGVAAPVPMRAVETEAKLCGLPLTEALAQVADLVRDEIKPRDSWRASKAFRLQIAGEMAQRAIAAAAEGGKGQ